MYLCQVRLKSLIAIFFLTLTLQACASPLANEPNNVADAYKDPGVVSVSNYTRSIFNSNNF